MPKYSRRETEAWTLSSTALGWGLTGVTILLVVFFGAGFYVGYNWGFDQAEQMAQKDRPELPEDELAALLEGEDTAPEKLQVESETEKDSAPDKTEDESEGSGEESLSEEDLGLSIDEEQPEDEPVELEQGSTSTEDTSGADRDEPAGPVEADRTPGLVESEGSDSEGEPQKTGTGSETAPEGDQAAPTESQSPGQLDQFYVIQVSSSEKRKTARKLAEQLRSQDYMAQVVETNVEGDTWFRVRVGEYPSRDQAEEAADQMVDKGDIDSYWISFVRR